MNNILKKFIGLILTLCMMTGMCISTYASASEPPMIFRRSS